MRTCGSCSAVLDPAWKYCVYCGLATSAVEILEIPSAIRPWQNDPAHDPEAALERKLVFTVVATICFLLGVALFAIALVVVLEHFR